MERAIQVQLLAFLQNVTYLQTTNRTESAAVVYLTDYILEHMDR